MQKRQIKKKKIMRGGDYQFIDKYLEFKFRTTHKDDIHKTELYMYLAVNPKAVDYMTQRIHLWQNLQDNEKIWEKLCDNNSDDVVGLLINSSDTNKNEENIQRFKNKLAKFPSALPFLTKHYEKCITTTNCDKSIQDGCLAFFENLCSNPDTKAINILKENEIIWDGNMVCWMNLCKNPNSEAIEYVFSSGKIEEYCLSVFENTNEEAIKLLSKTINIKKLLTDKFENLRWLYFYTLCKNNSNEAIKLLNTLFENNELFESWKKLNFESCWLELSKNTNDDAMRFIEENIDVYFDMIKNEKEKDIPEKIQTFFGNLCSNPNIFSHTNLLEEIKTTCKEYKIPISRVFSGYSNESNSPKIKLKEILANCLSAYKTATTDTETINTETISKLFRPQLFENFNYDFLSRNPNILSIIAEDIWPEDFPYELKIIFRDKLLGILDPRIFLTNPHIFPDDTGIK